MWNVVPAAITKFRLYEGNLGETTTFDVMRVVSKLNANWGRNEDTQLFGERFFP